LAKIDPVKAKPIILEAAKQLVLNPPEASNPHDVQQIRKKGVALFKKHGDKAIEDYLVGLMKVEADENVRRALANAIYAMHKRHVQKDAKPQTGKNTDGGKQGGIDFRALPLTTQPALNLQSLTVPQELISASSVDMDRKWQALQKKIASGPVPYQELQGYVAACCKRQECRKQLEAVSSYICELLKMEEEAAVATAPELKQILSCLS
jgi:hypothetical protein